MALVHAGFTIYGTLKSFKPPGWEFDELQIGVFGLAGVGVLQGGITKREFSLPIWIANSYNQAQLLAYLESLHDRAGAIGSLVLSGTISKTLTNVEFLKIDADDLIPPNPEIGWSCEALLHFRQLTPA